MAHRWFALSSGAFWYYFGGLRKSDATASRLSRDRIMAGISAAVVVITDGVTLAWLVDRDSAAALAALDAFATQLATLAR